MSYVLSMRFAIRWRPAYDPSVSLIVKGLKERFANDPLFQREFVAREDVFEAVDDYQIDHLPPEYSIAVREIVDRCVAEGPEAYQGVASPHAWERCFAELVDFQRVLAERLPPPK